MVDTSAVSKHETVLPVVPMFHVNAWGLPYSSALAGAKQVFPAPSCSIARSPTSSRPSVTLAVGIPLIWNRLYHYLKANRRDFSRLHTLFVGGAAVPRTVIEGFAHDFGINVIEAGDGNVPFGAFLRLK